MRNSICILAVFFFFLGCSGIRTPPEEQKLFVKEPSISNHGRKTLYDHVVDIDPGRIKSKTSTLFYELPPKTIAVLPFVDKDSGNFYLDKVAVTNRNPQWKEQYRWTRAQRVRKLIYGNLAQREYYPIKLEKIDTVLKEHGIKNSTDLSKISPEVLGSWLKVDAVIYGIVKNYESYYAGIICGYSIATDVQMLSTKTGDQLFYSSASRNQLGFDFGLNPTDLALNMIANGTYLRDVVLRRAEEDISREIVFRIPTRRPLPYFPQTEKTKLSENQTKAKKKKKESLGHSSNSNSQLLANKKSEQPPIMRHSFGNIPQNDAITMDHPTFSAHLFRKEKETKNETKEQIKKADFALAPIEEARMDHHNKKELALPSNLLSSVPQQSFFLPEIAEKQHGKKTMFDRLIEMDIQKPEVIVHPSYSSKTCGTIAILPFSDQATGGNLLINRIPLFPKTKEQKENWRWIVGNRIRKAIACYLAQRDFDILNIGETDTILKSHGLSTMKDLLRVPAKTLGRWLSVDSLIYGEVTNYEGFYSIVWAAWRVGAKLNLVSTHSGITLFTTQATRTSNRFIPAITPIDLAIAGVTTMTTMMRDYKLRQAEEELSRELVLSFPKEDNISEEKEPRKVPINKAHKISFLENSSSKRKNPFLALKDNKI
ncbi:GNA1162 family protein [Methylacidiphilum kamchatkense]|uniref:GNA1162 family protein n=1 Tax=Methylacidiphilum kamchatkense TaxID=431057 RepID=UPI00068B75BE|nr:GNA1162 family protein [Methylacidiphilum kamchatkense]